MRNLSPVLTIPKSPPMADSGETLRIEGLSEVPLCLPSPKVGSALIPCFNNRSGVAYSPLLQSQDNPPVHSLE